jgi:predicted amidohydrolase YtcJ
MKSFKQTTYLVLFNARIITMDEKNTVAEAVAIKNGIIVKVGSSKEMVNLPNENTERIDLKGKTILPGFIDAHTHI